MRLEFTYAVLVGPGGFEQRLGLYGQGAMHLLAIEGTVGMDRLREVARDALRTYATLPGEWAVELRRIEGEVAVLERLTA